MSGEINLGVVDGRRGRGRPCTFWMDGVKDATKLPLPELWEESAGSGYLKKSDHGMSPEDKQRLDETRQLDYQNYVAFFL